jgi:hypothetical protein
MKCTEDICVFSRGGAALHHGQPEIWRITPKFDSHEHREKQQRAYRKMLNQSTIWENKLTGNSEYTRNLPVTRTK